MVVHVVSLFLPYTLDFQVPESPSQQSRAEDYFGDPERRLSLLEKTQPIPAKTPGITADEAAFFAQNQPKAATHFVKPHDPRTLMRSDAHVADWGAGLLFNHPPSRAQELPPRTLLGHYAAQPGQDLLGLNNGVGIGAPRKKRSPTPSARKSNASRSTSGQRGKYWGSEWTVEPAEQGNGGLANAIKAAERDNTVGDDIIWMGTLGFPTDSLEENVKNDICEKFDSEELQSLVVFVSDSDFDGHYTHFCKTILWPVFHYQIPDHPKSKAYEDHSYGFYVKVNQAFADKIVASYKRGDMIWIHDYHLLLVPNMVRQKLPDAKIGFFLHTAFPSSEVFRCLSVRKELLEGMLGANLIAFQCPEYEEHFLTTCSRLLVVEAMENGIQLEDRFINVVSTPIGVDPKGFSDARQMEEVAEWIATMKERYKGKKIIAARDKLDHVRGVRQKLLAFELFLNKYPEYKEDVVLIQVATSTPDNPQLTDVVSEIVNRIDSQHSTLAHQPLVFLRQDIPFSQYLALLSVADVLMITSLREGMNLTCHEYILCQDGSMSDKKHGPVILSEFTGSSSVFQGGDLAVNPWDYKTCAQAIKVALEMPVEEKERRYNQLRGIVLNQTGGVWVKELIDDLNKFHAEHQQREMSAIPRLNIAGLTNKYREARNRLFLLDYDGTLANISNPQHVHLNNPYRVIETLTKLSSIPGNLVYVMSGRTPEELSRAFNYLPNVGLIAENGCFVRPFAKDQWTMFPQKAAMLEWKENVKQILQYYHERIAGSRVEEKNCSLIFRYDDVKPEDMESAQRQAGDCANHIDAACSSHRIHAVPIKNGVLIEPLDWTKASAAAWVFDGLRKEVDGEDKAKADGDIDFLFVAGDDREDESAFKWANKLGVSGVVRDVTTVSLGKRNTEAAATLTQGTSGLLSVLKKLSAL
ncbi:alpha,alpha-trehalose phosphate synthase-like protein subunit [Microthyrium microscopicum]|uniref:Alpha,alpha-trehalose phosphate synthase-like protein subunit n=1 Tax=Microthyrium microscopicum TaxID=703497 RepID=A0A6A6U0Y1_9PEZI|nr:alpha,alpha-trehalose phosphate synthase-like protein subunit [Microthyrium microscopicum]